MGSGSDGSTIRGLVINRFPADGIFAQSNSNTIEGNFIGVNPLGDAAEPNQFDGVYIESSLANTIGGTSPAARNIISGNGGNGVRLLFTAASPPVGTTIEGNFIGTNATGTGPVGFRPSDGSFAGNALYGIEVSGGTNSAIGGTTAGARNVIGFNFDGIELDDGAQYNDVQGNFVGVGADGVTAVGQEMHGIALRSNDNLAPPLGPGLTNEMAVAGNAIGGTVAGAGNLIEFNGSAGVAVFGSPLPNNGAPMQNSGNSILGNSIFSNGASNPSILPGIDLSNKFVYPIDDGVTQNGSAGHGTAHSPNNMQNFPVLHYPTFSGGHTVVVGSLTQTVSPSVTYRIEFFSNSACSATKFGEGETYLGFLNTNANGSGVAGFIASLPLIAPTDSITATATNTTPDPGAQAGAINVMNTSEFSACVSDLIFRNGFDS